MRTSSAIVTGVVFAALAVLAFACQRDETPRQVESTPSQATTNAGGPENSPPASTTGVIPPEKDERASAPTPGTAATQEVHLIEYEIHLPATLKAGHVAFNVENAGKEDHGFVIEGNGVHRETVVLKRGDTAAVEADLKPGTYTVWCPVKGHAARGMKTTITVQ